METFFNSELLQALRFLFGLACVLIVAAFGWSLYGLIEVVRFHWGLYISRRSNEHVQDMHREY